MLLPMPNMPMQLGPPSDYVQGKTPHLLFILLLQTTLNVLRIVFFLDIIGGFIMAIMVAVGWYAYRESMNITYLCFWGTMCLINGSFDLVRLIDDWVKSPTPLFSSTFSPGQNLFSAVYLLIPVSELLGALLAWFFYRHHVEEEEAGFHAYGQAYRDDARVPLVQNSGPRWGMQGAQYGGAQYGAAGGAGFQQFGGEGRRLGT